MARRFPGIFSIFGLLVAVAAWAGAVTVAVVRPGGRSCYTFGLASGERWLVSAVIYPDGFVLVQQFSPNLTHLRGLYAKLSHMNQGHDFTLGSLIPKPNKGRVAGGFTFHFVTPLIVFAALTFVTVALPLIRRRRRRKHGLCLRCGYDLRGATSDVCPECGHVNRHVRAATPGSRVSSGE